MRRQGEVLPRSLIASTLEVAGDSVFMLGDGLMIRRALSNLLSNAIRYTPSGETVSVLLGTAAEPATGTVKIRVQNPGPPIPAEHLPRIFERFYRPDSSRRRSGEGAGLGLAIVKSIIDAHGGSISASSNERATAFEISAPGVTHGVRVHIRAAPLCAEPKET